MKLGPAGGGREDDRQRTKEIPPDKTSGEDETMNEPMKKKSRGRSPCCEPTSPRLLLPALLDRHAVRAPYEVVVDLETHGYYSRKSEKSTLL